MVVASSSRFWATVVTMGFMASFFSDVAATEVFRLRSSLQGESSGLLLTGRSDTLVQSYSELAASLQSEWEVAHGLPLHVFVASDLETADSLISELRDDLNVSQVLLGGHSMQEGGITAQQYAVDNSENVDGLVLIASFLLRHHRPSIVECLAKLQEPVYTPPQDCRLGCLEDGVHDCYGDNSVDFPLPTLTVGGSLDGVTRITRMAESWYTQVELTSGGISSLPVVVVEGLNHGQLLTGALSSQISMMDLTSEISDEAGRSAVGAAFAAFFGPKQQFGSAMMNELTLKSQEFFAPVVDAFAVMEGSWFFTGGDDEHGSSAWAAMAHEKMMSPLPEGITWTENPLDESRLVSDAPFVPPYYREEHRPVLVTSGSEMSYSRTVSQLRFANISIRESQLGLNSTAIIRDEKINILTEFPDDGLNYLSAFELTTKMNSRQLVFEMFGLDAPPSLDDGDRCKDINEAAYAWALDTVSPLARDRYNEFGTKYVFVEDASPLVEAGPFFIWSYITYTATEEDTVEVQALKAFFPLDAGEYGAGNHYCKLISPARIVEWIMVDSLRTKLECPGGSLGECIGLCPATPPEAFNECLEVCTVACQ